MSLQKPTSGFPVQGFGRVGRNSVQAQGMENLPGARRRAGVRQLKGHPSKASDHFGQAVHVLPNTPQKLRENKTYLVQDLGSDP